MDLIMILLIIVLPLIAQLKVSSNYKRYSKVKNFNNKTGLEIAREILDRNDLVYVDVVEVAGDLTDHYDPSKQVVRLSSAVYRGTSVSSTAIAAHECGHAIQDKEKYRPMRIRSLIVPTVNIATSVSYWIILIGFIFQIMNLIYLGITLTSFGLIFQLVTLPVEFDASKRAKKMLEDYMLVNQNEYKGVRKVLSAAAMTYVAGVLASAIQILRLILMAQDKR